MARRAAQTRDRDHRQPRRPRRCSSFSARMRLVARFIYCARPAQDSSRRCAGRGSMPPSCARRLYRASPYDARRAGLAVLDPFTAGALAVLEAARNVACVGGEPLGITDCLNFGSPEKAEVGWALAEAIGASHRRARRSACRSSPGTSPSTTTRTAARSCRRRSSAAWASSPTCGSSRGRGSRETSSSRLGRPRPSLVGSEYQARYDERAAGHRSSTSRQAARSLSGVAPRLLARPRRLRRRPRRRARRGGPLVGRRGEARPP